jgi:hypothetical protein
LCVAAPHRSISEVRMTAHVLVWDLETVPDLRGFAAANGLDGKSDDEIRAARKLSCGGHYGAVNCSMTGF